ncbi:MAG: alpha/beta hydrolase [Methanobacterium sp.]|nr:alpha/beta hydrolase [Methanobacterium sp.]
MKIIIIILIFLVVIPIILIIWHVITLFKKPDFSNIPIYYPFKSEKAKIKYYEYYDKRSEEYPVISETKYLETSYGKTFIRICGDEKNPPLVLLPSANSSSLIWVSNIKTLSENFRVYAVDNIYDVGRSVNSCPIKNSDDLVNWLDELFTKLELSDNINLMGLSFGGWLTSQYALRFPNRLNKIVLAAPVATVIQLPAAWAYRAILGALPHRYFMKIFFVNWMFQNLVKKKDDNSIALINKFINDGLMVMKCYKFRMPLTPSVLTDFELQNLKIPVLFIVGENEVIYPAKNAIQRLNSVAPNIKTEIIKDASHDLTISQSEIFNNLVTNFLNGNDK